MKSIEINENSFVKMSQNFPPNLFPIREDEFLQQNKEHLKFKDPEKQNFLNSDD